MVPVRGLIYNKWRFEVHTQLCVLYSEISLGSQGQKFCFLHGIFQWKENYIEDEAFEKFKGFARKRQIKEENIMHIKNSGKGITLFPHYIIYLPGM